MFHKKGSYLPNIQLTGNATLKTNVRAENPGLYTMTNPGIK